MVDWAVTFAAFSKTLEAAKMLRDFEKHFDEATFKLKIADLTVTLADFKIALTEAQEDASKKDAEIADLRRNFAFREEQTVRIRDFRYQAAPDGSAQGMPFCPRCEVVDGRFVRLAGTRTKDGYKAICPQCKADCGMEHAYTYPQDRRPAS
jgi:hypothetical protein